TARVLHRATTLANGKVLVTGGQANGGPATNTTETFEYAVGTWTNAGAMSTPRSGYSTTLLPSGKVLVAAGQIGGGATNSAELFNPATATWTAAGSLTAARQGHAAVLLPGGQVLVAGGVDRNGNAMTNSE